MPSPRIADTLLALEPQKALALPLATLILGAMSQVEALIELVDRVYDPKSRRPSKGHPSASLS